MNILKIGICKNLTSKIYIFLIFYEDYFSSLNYNPVCGLLYPYIGYSGQVE